ncbi:hypothetical protein D3C81_1906670 [compost metagenome]
MGFLHGLCDIRRSQNTAEAHVLAFALHCNQTTITRKGVGIDTALPLPVAPVRLEIDSKTRAGDCYGQALKLLPIGRNWVLSCM